MDPYFCEGDVSFAKGEMCRAETSFKMLVNNLPESGHPWRWESNRAYSRALQPHPL